MAITALPDIYLNSFVIVPVSLAGVVPSCCSLVSSFDVFPLYCDLVDVR